MGYIQEIRKKVGHDEVIAVGAGVFVCRGGEVLLQKRRDNLCWATQGGCLEIGENTEEAARRELLEETGLSAGALEFLGVFSGQEMRYTYPNGDKLCVVGVYYVCRDFSGGLQPQEDEVLELRWFSLDALPREITPLDRKPLEALVDFVRRRS